MEQITQKLSILHESGVITPAAYQTATQTLYRLASHTYTSNDPLEALTVHLAIALSRIERGEELPGTEEDAAMMMEDAMQSEEYEKCMTIVEALEQEIQQKLPMLETPYLLAHLINVHAHIKKSQSS